MTTLVDCSEFDCGGVYVNDKQTQSVLKQGITREGLCVLHDPKFQAFYSIRQLPTSEEVCHRRLVHPHSQVLKFL